MWVDDRSAVWKRSFQLDCSESDHSSYAIRLTITSKFEKRTCDWSFVIVIRFFSTGKIFIRRSVFSLTIILFDLSIKTLSSDPWIQFDCFYRSLNSNTKKHETQWWRSSVPHIFLYICNDDRKNRRTDPNTFDENNLSSTMICFNWSPFDSILIIFDTDARSSICFYLIRKTKELWAFVESYLFTSSVLYRVEYLIVDLVSKRDVFS